MKNNHFLSKPSTLFLSTVSLSTFISSLTLSYFSESFHCFFFWFPEWAFFFSCSILDCLFWVSASVLPSLSSNLSVRSSRSYYFWLLVLLTSLRPRTVTANSSQLFKSYRLYCLFPDLLSSIPLFDIPLITRMSFSLFHDMIDLRKGGNRFVYSLFKTLRRKAIPRA